MTLLTSRGRSHATSLFTLLSLLGFRVTGIAWGEMASSILRNPSFEEGSQSPRGWSFNHRGSEGEIAWDRQRGRTGEAAVRLRNRTARETGNVLQTVRLSEPLRPGSRVSFSAWAACQEAGGAPLIIVYLMDATGHRKTVVARGAGGTHDFVHVAGEAVVDRPVHILVIYLCHYSTGTVWWDDATLTVHRAKPRRIIERQAGGRALAPLRTKDGLALSFTSTGAVTGLQVDGRDVTRRATRSGLWLRPYGGDTLAVTGVVRLADGSVVQQFSAVEAGLRVEARFRAQGDAIRCTGFVADTTGEDRGIDLWFALPVGDAAWRWGESLRAQPPIGKQAHRVDEMTFSSLSASDGRVGLSLAVSADAPCDCAFTHESEFNYSVRFRFGLSPDAAGDLRSRAPFAFLIYRCDGRWGLRDAARRYYELHPQAFVKRASREGLWLFGAPPKWLPDPENYGFHEGGPRGWEYDDQHDIATCPYIIPGQREMKRLPRLPATTEEAMKLLRNYRPQVDAGRPSWGSKLKAIIQNCLLHDRAGRPQNVIRRTPWGGNSVSFPLNASPAIPADDQHPTVAGELLSQVRQWHEETRALDGIYVDSLGLWGEFLNHRHEHFASARIPLSYDPIDGSPVIANRFSLLEFLWSLGDFLHAGNKLVFANGLHPDRRFHFFACDVMGVEGHGKLEQKRIMAGRKPFLLLIYNIHDKPDEMERYYHLCTLYGIYPSFGNMKVFAAPEAYAPVAALNRCFVPVLRTITSAGWQPVTHATADSDKVWIERWGPAGDGSLYLTVYNPTGGPLDAKLTLETGALGIGGATITVTDILSGGRWQAGVKAGAATWALSLPAQKVRVLQVDGTGESGVN